MLKTTAIGNLVADPTFRTVTRAADGAQMDVVNFRIAVNNANGRGSVDYIECSGWSEGIIKAAHYLTKGRKVAVEGPISATVNYSDKTKKHYANLRLRIATMEFLDANPNRQKADEPVPAFDEQVPEFTAADLPV